MKVNVNSSDSNLIIGISGSINTDTVSNLRNEVETIDFDSFDSVALDFNDVNYISSAGLRELLVMQKRFSKGKIQVLNATQGVYDVFSITGFDKILDVKKQEENDDLTKCSFKEFLKKKVDMHKDEIILSANDQQVTWENLDKMSDLIAEDLLNLGVKKGSHVGICSANSINWIATFFAIQKLGALAILVNPILGAGEIQFLSKAGDIEYLCFGPCVGIANNPQEFLGKLCDKENSNIKYLYNIVNAVDMNREVSNIARVAIDGVDVKADDAAVMIFTSGSTGVPKGVLLSSYNVLSAAVCGNKALDLANDDIMCLVLPLFHIFGLVASLLVSMIENIKIVIPDKVKAEPIMDIIQKEKATILLSVPTLVLMIVASPEFSQDKIASLRHVALGGAPVSEAQMLLLTNKLPNALFYIVYGLSEMSPVSFTIKNDSIEHITKSIGVPTYLVNVMIQDVVSKQESPTGETGEILVQGESLMSGYYKTPIEKQDFDNEGWFHTGDLGFLDDEEYIHFAGRKKELIIRGGENIFPGEIQDVCLKYKGVIGTQIIGLPDDYYGEIVSAALMINDNNFNLDDFKNYLKNELASHKIPSHIFIYDQFPYLANGKVDVLSLKKDMLSKVK